MESLGLHNGGMNFVSRKVAKEQRRKVLDFEFSNFIPQYGYQQRRNLLS